MPRDIQYKNSPRHLRYGRCRTTRRHIVFANREAEEASTERTTT